MAVGFQARMHVLIDYCAALRLSANGQADRVFAVIEADGQHIAFSGPTEQVSAVLRELADKVDATARESADAR